MRTGRDGNRVYVMRSRNYVADVAVELSPKWSPTSIFKDKSVCYTDRKHW